MSILAGKKLLVTGGSRGIGSAIVRTAMQEGAEVAFTYLNSAEEAQSLVDELSVTHPSQRCRSWQCDATDPQAMERWSKKRSRSSYGSTPW